MSNFRTVGENDLMPPTPVNDCEVLCIIFLSAQTWLVPYRVQLSLVCMCTGHSFLSFPAALVVCVYKRSCQVAKIEASLLSFCCRSAILKLMPPSCAEPAIFIRMLFLACHSCTWHAFFLRLLVGINSRIFSDGCNLRDH